MSKLCSLLEHRATLDFFYNAIIFLIMDRKLVAVAMRARKWAEDYARSTHLFPNDLTGMCAIASAKVFNLLKLSGYTDVIIYECRLAVMAHCFLVVNQSIVIDVTATQFER